jgi:hypothetical protein
LALCMRHLFFKFSFLFLWNGSEVNAAKIMSTSNWCKQIFLAQIPIYPIASLIINGKSLANFWSFRDFMIVLVGYFELS